MAGGVRLKSDTGSRSRRLLVQPEVGDDARGLLELAGLGQEARIEMPSVEARRRRLGKLAPAAVERMRTARAEAAARGRPQEGRRLALDLRQTLELDVEPRQRAEEAPGVRMHRALEQRE